ncbi:MAG: hypothetical protein QXI60_09105 [Thermofilaceae archaeon]
MGGKFCPTRFWTNLLFFLVLCPVDNLPKEGDVGSAASTGRTGPHNEVSGFEALQSTVNLAKGQARYFLKLFKPYVYNTILGPN